MPPPRAVVPHLHLPQLAHVGRPPHLKQVQLPLLKVLPGRVAKLVGACSSRSGVSGALPARSCAQGSAAPALPRLPRSVRNTLPLLPAPRKSDVCNSRR